MNKLYFGDNLTVLKDHVRDETVDLVYLDPPFNSQRNYNVLFGSHGRASEAQVEAFKDTWSWESDAAKDAYQDILDRHDKLALLVRGLRSALGESAMMAYIVMMAVRVIELHRVIKPTGSLYLHCDPTASHYIKIVLDTIFDPRNFRSELIWRRSSAHNKLSRQYGPIHDTILFYSATDKPVFHPGYTPYTKQYLAKLFRQTGERGRFRMNELTGSGTRRGESGQPWGGYDPTPRGRHWAIPASYSKSLASTRKE